MNLPEERASAADLESFLEQQVQAGDADSSGTFTLDPERARAKIEAYALGRKGEFILKMVQAAVAAGTDRIEVGFGRDTLSFSFQLQDAGPFLADRVWGALLSLGSLQASPLRHLAVGLTVACHGELVEARWQTPEGTLVITPDTMRCDAQLHYPRFSLVLRRKRYLATSLSMAIRSYQFGTLFIDEYRALLERCQFAPVDLVVDGRALERPLYDRYRAYYAKGMELPRAGYLVERWRAGSGLWFRRPPDGAYEGVRWSGRLESKEPVGLLLVPHKPLDDLGERVEVGASVAVLPVDEGLGHVTFVKDGVTLQKWHGDLGHPAVSVIADASELSVDLSEFKLLENRAFHEKIEDLSTWVRLTTEGVSRHEVDGILRAGRVERFTRDHDAAYLHHWLQNHEPPKTDFHVRATKDNIGLSPAFGERLLLSLSSMKRFALWVHFKCRAIATDRRLIFWNRKHAKHSWQLTWNQVAKRQITVVYGTDLYLQTEEERRLEMAFDNEADMKRMKELIDDRLSRVKT